MFGEWGTNYTIILFKGIIYEEFSQLTGNKGRLAACGGPWGHERPDGVRPQRSHDAPPFASCLMRPQLQLQQPPYDDAPKRMPKGTKRILRDDPARKRTYSQSHWSAYSPRATGHCTFTSKKMILPPPPSNLIITYMTHKLTMRYSATKQTTDNECQARTLGHRVNTSWFAVRNTYEVLMMKTVGLYCMYCVLCSVELSVVELSSLAGRRTAKHSIEWVKELAKAELWATSRVRAPCHVMRRRFRSLTGLIALPIYTAFSHLIHPL